MKPQPNRISVLIRRNTRELACSLSLSPCVLRGTLWWCIEKASTNQNECSDQELNQLAPWSGTSQPPEPRPSKSLLYKPECGILLQQHELTNSGVREEKNYDLKHEGTKDKLCHPENVAQTLSAANTFRPWRSCLGHLAPGHVGHTAVDVKKLPIDGSINHETPTLQILT